MTAPGELVSFSDILAARERLRNTAVRTPLVHLDPARIQQAGLAQDLRSREIYLKNEAAQPVGSFKLRGAYNKIASVKQRDPEGFRRGVITFSSGNHAQGVAFAARALGTRAVIVMPMNAPEIKRKTTEALGAEIVTVGPASTERKLRAEELVALHGYVMIPPYDDLEIIAGQATCGIETAEQVASLPGGSSGETLILAPVSGGGLLSGVATGAKLAAAAQRETASLKVWGAEPELAADARESFYSGQLVEWPASHTTRTLADGLRTQSLGRRNLDHILHFVDGIVSVTEEEIRQATQLILTATDIVAEPSGAVALAAALFHPLELPDARRIVAVVSGGNIDPSLQKELLAQASADRSSHAIEQPEAL